MTFWAFVAQVLAPGTSCRGLARKVEAWWRWAEGCARTVTASAYCQARSRLDLDTLELIGAHLAWSLERHVRPAERWLGRRVRIVDGTNLSMPDTTANQEAWPQSPSQAPGLGFPLMKLVGLFSLSSGALLARASGRWSAHESRLFLEGLAPKLQRGDVLLADRGFCSYLLLAQLLGRGVAAVVRLHGARRADLDFRRVGAGGRRLGVGDKLALWTKPLQRQAGWPAPEVFAALPATLTVRLVRVEVAVKGFRTRRVVVATTLLDPAAYPAAEIAALYRRRWAVEGHFAQIKTTLGLDVLRAKSPEIVEKEVAVHAIAYNLVRALMQQAAHAHQVDLARLSFAGSRAALEHWAGVIHAAAGQPRRQAQLIEELLAVLAGADNRVRPRPGRSEPRVKKRRAKNYQLLTRPRHEMGNQPHRNKPAKRSAKTALS